MANKIINSPPNPNNMTYDIENDLQQSVESLRGQKSQSEISAIDPTQNE